jgi:transposase InsO family protein
VNPVPYELPSQLGRAIAGLADYYNFRRYHKALGDMTPADVLSLPMVIKKSASD